MALKLIISFSQYLSLSQRHNTLTNVNDPSYHYLYKTVMTLMVGLVLSSAQNSTTNSAVIKTLMWKDCLKAFVKSVR